MLQPSLTRDSEFETRWLMAVLFDSLFLLFSILPCYTQAANYPWPDHVTQYKGYIDLKDKHGVAYFYWFFESRTNPSTDPLVLWLTGGPGCSSLFALFGENGPFLLNTTTEPAYNPYSWNSFANLLYVDQPAGTGFSYVSNPSKYYTNEKEIAQALWEFLLGFFEKYPKYSQLHFYIIGESYAGHYVPAIGQLITQVNSVYASNLKGIAIGNGWVDPYIQFKAYAQYAYANDLINRTILDIANVMYDACKIFINMHIYPIAFEWCEKLETLVLNNAKIKLNRTINPYDIRKPCEEHLCYNITAMTIFLDRDDIRSELGVGNHTWVSCKKGVELALIRDWVHEFKDAVSSVLKGGRKVLVYSGKEDYICNYFGGREWANTTKWDGMIKFQQAPYNNWMVDGSLAGEAKSYGPLTFLALEAAGHMVPRDQPKNALDMLKRFLNNQPFN